MSIIFKAPVRLEAQDVRVLRQDFERLALSQSDVVIDLARTEALDGSGVGALVYAFKRLRAGGKCLTVRNVSGQPLNLLNESGLLRTLSREQPEGFLRATVRRLRNERIAETDASPAVAIEVAGTAADADRTKGAA